MNSFLANMRWICLRSENLGQDWFEKSKAIDAVLAGEGMDLAEEAVYLLYSSGPQSVLEGEGQCLVARSVIGPKKNIEGGYHLIDWTASPVDRFSLTKKTLMEMVDEASSLRPELKKGFTICVKRRLVPELTLETEVIFSE